MFGRTPPAPPQAQTPPSPPAPPDEGIRISSKALRILAYCALGIVGLWAAVEFVKLGADPSVLPIILKALKL